jgi:L-ascorbate metabolism protein UlaG (beta-lactamase superfamily)
MVVKIARRRFLKFSLLGGVGFTGLTAFWLAVSQRRAARWLRTIIADSRRKILPAPSKANPAAWSDNGVTICWLGHATVLINFYGIRLLLDPALYGRVGINVGIGTAGPKRYVAPALQLRELPPIDVLLLTHAHMDHMDLPSLRWFPKDTFTVTAANTSDILQGLQLRNLHEMRWKDKQRFTCNRGDLEIEAVEVKHWGKRFPNEKIDRGYNGLILRREGKALLLAGDTASTPLFSALRSKGPFDAAIMPIGAYNPWIRSHCTPEEAVAMANAAGARYIVPIHHQTFKLSDEPMTEPLERVQAALKHEPERLALQKIGESFTCPG